MRLALAAPGLILATSLFSACYHPQPVGKLGPALAPSLSDEETAPVAMEALSAAQTVALALKHPRLEAAALRIDVARANVEAAGAWPNPELRLNSWRLGEGAGPAVERMDMELRVRPERPGWLDSQRDRARFDVQIRQARAKAQRVAVVLQARRLHAHLTVGVSLQQAESVRSQLLERRLALMDKGLKAGLGTDLARRRAKVEMLEGQDRLRRREMRLDEAREALASLVGLDAPGLKVAGHPGGVEVETSPERAAVSSPDLSDVPAVLEATSRIGQAEAEAWQERARRWPSVSFVEVGYDLNDADKELPLNVGVALELPLLDWNGGAVDAAEARVAHERKSRIAESRVAADQVREGRRRATRTLSRLTFVRDTWLPAAAGAAESAQKAEKLGHIAPLDAVEIALEHQTAILRALEARLEHVEAVIELDAALGQDGL